MLLNTLYIIGGILIVWFIPIIILTYKYRQYIKQIPTKFKKWLSQLNIYVHLHNLLIVSFIVFDVVFGLIIFWLSLFILLPILMPRLNTFFVIGLTSGTIILTFAIMITLTIYFVKQDFDGFKDSKLTFMKKFYKHYYEQIKKQ